jgi:hypothetical protein
MLRAVPLFILLAIINTPASCQTTSPPVVDIKQLEVRGNRVFIQGTKMRNATISKMLNQYEESALYWKKFRKQTWKIKAVEAVGLIGTAVLLSDASLFTPQETDWWRLISVGVLDGLLTLIDIKLRQKRHQYLIWSVERYNHRSIQRFLY